MASFDRFKLHLCIVLAAVCQTSIAQSQQDIGINKSISIAVGKEPPSYVMENDMHLIVGIVGAWIPLLANKARNKTMGAEFTAANYRMAPRYSSYLMQEIAKNIDSSDKLRVSTPLMSITSDIGPEKISHASFKVDSDYLLFVKIDSIGIRSHHNSSMYQPVIYVSGCLIGKNSTKCDDYPSAAYGDNYDDDGDYYFASNKGDRWRNESDVYSRLNDVDKAFRHGLDKVARGIASQVTEKINDRTH